MERESNAIERFCVGCRESFPITDRDRAFYHKMEVPEPTLCPECRSRRRLGHVNQTNLFKRTCDATGKPIISHYAPESPYKVFSQTHWYSDAFDGTAYGRDFDFERPFFEQFNELSLAVPRPALFTDFLHDENSDFTNYAGRNKNCYLIFDSDENWDCYYSYGMNGSRNSLDCYRVDKVELCYQTIDSRNCYGCAFIYDCETCSDSMFLSNCIGCKNCIFCSNLHQKQFHIYNKPVSREEFAVYRKQLASHQSLQKKIAEFQEYRLKFPQKYLHGFQNENVSGDHLVHSKNALWCFDCRELWDGKYCNQIFIKSKDCMDCQECGEGELIYECCEIGYNAYNLRFCFSCLDQLTNLTYCISCFTSCADLFGCVGLKRKKFCILNKEYSPSEYKILVDKIVAHMRSTGEWGEFMPVKYSEHAYNLSVCSEHFPLSRAEALAQGFSWREKEARDYLPATGNLPDRIEDTTESICQTLLSCESCQKNFKIIPQEYTALKNANLPLPRDCFNCRHTNRIMLRNPRFLWKRNCDQCKTPLETSYAPARPEIVYCEKCYVNSLT